MYPPQHAQMLVVRKEGKAHQRYNSFRSAFELLEVVGREPEDCFEDLQEDLPTLEGLDQRMKQLVSGMNQRIEQNQAQTQQHLERTQQRLDELQQQIDKLKEENEHLKEKLSIELL